MKKSYNRYLIIFVIILAVLTIWYEVDRRRTEESPGPVLPETRLSTLPEEIEKTISSLSKRAGELGRDNNNGIFGLLTKNKIVKNTPLVLQTYYKKSDQLQEYVTTMPSSFSGLTVEQLESTLREWDIREYQPGNALILHREKDQLSPEDKNNQYLGIKNGRVVIFYGLSANDNKKIVKKETSIKTEDLPQSEVNKLEDGIQIKSEEELLTILEGLLSYKQD